MIKIAICDDEKQGQKGLREIICSSGVFDDVEYCCFESGQAIIDAYKDGGRFGIVFLDVDMPGVNGIETGMYINETDPKAIIIFNSAYPQFAVDAFDCNAFHYIIKGSDEDKIVRILKRAYEKYKRINENFVFRCSKGVTSVPLSDIYYIEYMKKHVIIHTEKEKYDIRETMSNISDSLSGLGFYLCHQSFLVNFEKVKSIMKSDILLTNGESIMLSTRRRSEIVSAYSRYIENFVL